MPTKLNAFTLTLTLLCVVALAIAANAFASQATAAPTEYANYQNERFEFALSYPDYLVAEEQDERSGGQTILFTEPNGDHQFLIEAIPYLQVDIGASEYAPHEAYSTADQELQLREFNVVFSAASGRRTTPSG
jgi:hypothetical protein